MSKTFNDVKNECLSWHYDQESRDNTDEFFSQLLRDGALYNPLLNIAVLWCVWKSGTEVVDKTFEVVLDACPNYMNEHAELYGWDVWATDLLACFEHYSFTLYEDDDFFACTAVLSAICSVGGWTSNLKEAIKGD